MSSDNPEILEDYKVMIQHYDQDSCGPFVCNYGAMVVFHYLTGLPEFDIQHQKNFNKSHIKAMQQRQRNALIKKSTTTSDEITIYQPESDAEKSLAKNTSSSVSQYQALVKRKREEYEKETEKRPE
uniref:Uncharacterized protein n=1 Tax=Tetranychus urticae TaxID=32264 RepID=T1K4V9_TETUR